MFLKGEGGKRAAKEEGEEAQKIREPSKASEERKRNPREPDALLL